MRPIPVALSTHDEATHRTPLTLQAIQTVVVGFQPRAASRTLRANSSGVECCANRTSRSPSATELVGHRRCDAAHDPTRAHRDVHPTRRPSFNDTPNAGTAAAVSARCNNRPPSRTDVFAASASDFSGNDDTAAIRWANSTSRPSTHDFNRRRSATPAFNTTESAHADGTAATRPTRSCTSAVRIFPLWQGGVTR